LKAALLLQVLQLAKQLASPFVYTSWMCCPADGAYIVRNDYVLLISLDWLPMKLGGILGNK
jgi:hypothetical protein